MAEMTDQEVQERLVKYRRGKAIRRIGIAAACVAVIALAVFGVGACAKAIPAVDPMQTKPLVEWTEEEKAQNAGLYADRLASEPVVWKNLLQTGFAAPGKKVVHGKVLRFTIWAVLVAIAGNIVFAFLNGVIMASRPNAMALLLGRVWYLLESLLSLWILVLVAALLWRVLLA